MVEQGTILRSSFSKDPENKRDEKRKKNAAGQREIEGEVFPFNVDVARQPSQPGDFAGKGDEDADGDNYDTEDDKGLSQSGHDLPCYCITCG
jgi:hypothetical protein